MRLVFAGTPAVAVPALAAIAASRHELVAVVTRPDAPAGRGRGLSRSPVGAWADEHGIEVLTPARPREPEFLDRLRELAPDCVPVVAYGALVPPAALEIPRHGWINLHFSLLPAWRGAAPVQHAVLHGDELTGASVFQLEAGAGHRPGLRHPDRRDPPRRHLRRPAGAARRVGRRAAGRGARRDRGGHRPGRAAAGRRGVAGAEADRRGRPGALDRPGLRGGPADPRLHPGPRRRGRPSATSGSSSARSSRLANGPDLKPGELLVEKDRVLAGTATMPVQLGEVRAAGKRAMPARRLGARRPGRRRRGLA